MFSFLGGLFGLLMACLWKFFQRSVKGLDLAIDGWVQCFYVWLYGSYNSPQQTIASARLSVGPPGDLLTWLWSFVRPTPLARVRVPARRSIR
ncbi:MAG: hypothetical protein WCH39_15450 [Schlesneria sp.]